MLQAPPGAGKTTVVPLRLLDEPWLAGGRIVMLEPRRLATRAAARRMAALLGEEVGGTVGYRTRDERRTGPGTRIEVVTEGILTRRLQQDPSLPGVGLVIFDEFHERNLHADLALALTLDARAASPPRPASAGDVGHARHRPDRRPPRLGAPKRVQAPRRSSAAKGGPGRSTSGSRPPAPPARKVGYKGRPGPPPRPGCAGRAGGDRPRCCGHCGRRAATSSCSCPGRATSGGSRRRWRRRGRGCPTASTSGRSTARCRSPTRMRRWRRRRRAGGGSCCPPTSPRRA